MKKISLLLLASTFYSTSGFTNTKNDPHLPISHCYHWLDEKNSNFLTYKYQYGDKNNGDVAFVAGKNGAVAGPGLYCAKSPSGSYSYGDRVIRLDLVDDIVMYDSTRGKKYCGHDGKFYSTSECDKKPWDIKFYTGGGIGNSAWYVIKDPQAIAKWSANSDQLIADLNASKAVNYGGAVTHFDLTLKAINAERSKLGEKVYINHNARMSIITILTKPILLAQVPALNVISKVANVPNSDFSKKKKIKVYKEQFTRALKDTFLSFDDFDGTIKINTDIKQAFLSVLKSLDINNIAKYNIPVIMIGYDRYLKLNAAQATSIWKQALAGNSQLNNLINSPLQQKNALYQNFTKALAAHKNIVQKIPSHNIIHMISLIEKYAIKQIPGLSLTNLLETLLTRSIGNNPNIISVYKGLKNNLLNKKAALTKSISKKFTNKFQGLDPIIIGHLVDETSPNANTKAQYHKAILSLPIPVSKKATYLIADDFQKGTITLPSMISEYDYIEKLLVRALNERGQKGMTNSFRFVFSDIFHHFFSDIKKEKDDAKKAIKVQNAMNTFYDLAMSMPDPYFKSYSYIALQNASFFQNDMDYKEHPIEKAFENYGTGDVQFDGFFEDVTKHALEGSYTQFLIEHADDPKADKLLNIVVNFIISSEMDTWLNSAEFALSQKEKRGWKNMIFNKKYTWGGKFVSSDICRLSRVLHDKRRDLDKILDAATAKALKKKNSAIYKSKWCK